MGRAASAQGRRADHTGSRLTWQVWTTAGVIAIAIATQLGVSSEPFVLAVLFGANMSFATPYGYQTNLLIMSAGGYKFSDFLRVGIPLTIIMWAGFSLVLPLLYDL